MDHLLWRVHVHFGSAGSRLVSVPILGPGFFAVNSCKKLHPWHVHVSISAAYAQCATIVLLDLGPGMRIFPADSCLKCLLWDPRAYFVRAGSDKASVPILGRGTFSSKFLRQNFSWDVHVQFDHAGSCKVNVPMLGHGMLPANSRSKKLLWDIHVHSVAQAGSRKVSVAIPDLGPRLFPCRFSREHNLVRCPCGFRPRRLSQSVRLSFGPRHFLRRFWRHCCCEMARVPVLVHDTCVVDSRKNGSFCEVHVHVDCAGSHKTVVPVLLRTWSCTSPYQKILGEHPDIFL